MVLTESNEAIKAELAAQQKSLLSKVRARADALAKLEMAQLEKSMAQRELEKTHEAAVSLELALNDQSPEVVVRQLAQLKKRTAESKDRLNALAQGTARLIAELESLESAVSRTRSKVSEMEAAESGWFLSHDVRVRQPAPVATTRERVIKPATAATFEALPTIEGQVPQWELEREAWKLKAQAFRLKADAYKNSADAARANGTDTSTSTVDAESLLMQADANHAEAMALELTKQIEGLQAKQSGGMESSSAATFGRSGSEARPTKSEMAELRDAMAALRAENARLTEEILVKRRTTGLMRDDDTTEKDVLRPGDPIEVTLWPRDSKDPGQALHCASTQTVKCESIPTCRQSGFRASIRIRPPRSSATFSASRHRVIKRFECVGLIQRLSPTNPSLQRILRRARMVDFASTRSALSERLEIAAIGFHRQIKGRSTQCERATLCA